MKLHEFLMSHAIAQGKTHNLALLLKSLGGTLIVRDNKEATRINERYGIKAVPYNTNVEKLLGTKMGITYVDPDAVGLWISDLERKIQALEDEVEDLNSELYDARNRF